MIDPAALTGEQQIFFNSLVDAGFPADEGAFRARMQLLADDAHLVIANPSKYSAFWRFVECAVATPLRQIVRYLVTEGIPGFYLKTATGARLDLIAWAHGIERKAAVNAAGFLTLSRAAGAVAVVEIPAGTSVRSVSINGNVYRMITTTPGVIAENAADVKIPARAESAGANYNLGAGYYSLLDSDVPRVGSVTNDSDYLVTPGADEETDEELRLRVRDIFRSVGEWHTDAKYRAMIAARAGIRSDRIYFDHGKPRGEGSADAYIIFDAGTVPTAYLDDLNYYINTLGNHGHGDDLVCKSLPETKFALTVTLRFNTGISGALKIQLKSQVGAMIRCAFWDNNDYAESVTRAWPYTVFNFSRLAAELHLAIPELAGVTFSKTEFAARLELPKLNSITLAEAE